MGIDMKQRRLDANDIDYMNSLRWFHSIDLGNGVITPGGKGLPQGKKGGEAGLSFMQGELATLQLPDLSSKNVLDVGCRDGYYSFEAERQGADVLAIDTWANPAWPRHCMDFAHAALNSKVVVRQASVYDEFNNGTPCIADICKSEQADVSLFLGLIYHLKYPMWGLQSVANVTKDLLVLESHFSGGEDDSPMMKFLPGDELNNDHSCWWSPNIKMLECMLLTVGFVHVEVVSKRDDRVVLHGRK